MNIQPIRNEADYKGALKVISPFFDQEPMAGSEDADRFEIMLALIQVYEAKHHAIDPPDAIEAIKFRMEQDALTVKDLEPFIGRSNRVYEVLGRKRPLTLEMIRRLHAGLGISAEVLINNDEKFALAA